MERKSTSLVTIKSSGKRGTLLSYEWSGEMYDGIAVPPLGALKLCTDYYRQDFVNISETEEVTSQQCQN